jgi:pimeloyl-ACP methyl ester carboxylesterase
MTMIARDLVLDGGRKLHVYAEEAFDHERLAVFWPHGTSDIGLPLAPLFADAARLGLRWIGYGRPGYGGSTPREGRHVVSAARDVARLHGGRDRMVPKSHAEWLARQCPSAELWLQPEVGHISVLSEAPRALAWLREHAVPSDF